MDFFRNVVVFICLDPAVILEVPDMALLIPEVWDVYFLSNAIFFSIINLIFSSIFHS